MNKINYLEKLLDGAEVEWKPLGDAVKIQRGRRLVKSQLEEMGDFAVFQNSMVPLGYYHESNVEPDSAFIICAGAAGEIGYSTSGFWAADDVHFFQPPEGILSKFLYYWLLTQQNIILGQVRRASIPRLSKSVVEKFNFPILYPNDSKKSLVIQAEIVRILDAFTALTAELTTELTAELTARKKQYHHYRNQLLTFSNNTHVEWKPLGDVCDFKNGFSFKSNLFKDAGLPIIRITNINGKTINLSDVKYFDQADYKENMKAYEIAHGDILVAMSGATTGKVGFYDHHYTSYLNQRVGKFIPNAKLLNNRYLYHNLLSQVEKIYLLAGGGAQPNLSSNALKEKIYVPIPFPNDLTKSLAEQNRIATTLDKFDALAHSLTQGLPREIELRQKQYEYYRDLLLNFPKPEEVAA